MSGEGRLRMTTTSILIRVGALANMATGILFVVCALDFRLVEVLMGIYPNIENFNSLVVVMFVVAVLLIPVGLVGFHALQKERYRRLGRTGFYVGVVGSLVVALATPIAMGFLSQFGLPSPSWLPMVPIVVGPISMLVGFVLLGAATLKAGVLPRWCAIALMGALPVSLAYTPFDILTGVILFGLVWMALGYTLWRRRNTIAGELSRVR